MGIVVYSCVERSRLQNSITGATAEKAPHGDSGILRFWEVEFPERETLIGLPH
jgi:hypothetical protein